MTVSELVNELGLVIYSGEKGLERTVQGGYSSDLLSDVMGNAREGQVWVTLQTHRNVMAIASLKDLSAVLLVKGATPDEDMARQSEEDGVPVVGTQKETFQIAGEIYNKLKEHEIL